MKRPSLVSQGSLNRIFQAVNEAWKNFDFETAIEQMERASRLNPSNAGILLDLGRMHGLRYNFDDAWRCFEQAVRVAPNKTGVLIAAAEQSREFNNFDMAAHYCERALKQNDVSPITIVKLAEIYERLRRTEDANNLVDRVLQSDAVCVPALLLRARLYRQSGQLEAAEKILRAFPGSADWNLRSNVAYELGNILDRQSRYDEAMTSFLEAKAMLLPQATANIADLKIVRQRIQVMQANLTADILNRWLSVTPKLSPSSRIALLGGHPRSGTTLLEQVLDAHPAIVSVEETEIFHSDAYFPLARNLPADSSVMAILETASNEALKQSRDRYFNYVTKSLAQPIGDRLLVDKNPSLTFLIPALIRIFPEIKLLIALRDPRDVILSCFMQPFKLGPFSSPYLTLEGTVTEYVAMMDLWQTLAPMLEGRYLEVRYEDMVQDLESVARKTLNFLDIPWDARVLGFDAHARQKVVRSPTYSDVTQPVYKRAVGRWQHYQKYLEPHLEKLAPFIKAFGYE
jgi:tetratricopeptide (TPR) repeat protein